MNYRRSTPRKAWTCYFEGTGERQLKQLEKMFPMVQFVLSESSKLIISQTGERLLDNKVKDTVLEMGGIVM